MDVAASRRPYAALAALAGVALLLRLAVAWSPLDLLVAKVLPDDAFYYFGVARHIAAGAGVTFDGRTLTNGFHPLWMLLLTPLYALAGGTATPIHLALTLAALLDIATGVLVFVTARRVARHAWAGVVSAAFYLLNPAVILETLNGLETSLSLFTFMAVFAFYRACLAGVDWDADKRGQTRTNENADEGDHKDAPFDRGAARADGGPQTHPTDSASVRMRPRPMKDFVILGALAGLMILARTDAAVLILLIGLVILWRGRRAVIGRLALAAAVSAVVVAPWFGWSWLALGTPWQSSGSAMPTILRHLYQDAIQSGSLTPAQGLRFFVGGALSTAGLAFFYYAGMALLVIILALGFWRVLRPRLPAAPWRDVLAPLAPFALPIVAVLITLLIHTVYRWYPRNWYFAPAALALALPVGPLLAGAGRRVRGALRRPALYAVALALLVGAVFLAQGLKTWRAGVYPWQAGFLAGAAWARQQTAPDEVIGAFNAGILGYFSRRETVNLDGVTDASAGRALAGRRIADYAAERRLGYVIDYSAYVEDMYAPFYGKRVEEWLRPAAVAGAPDARYGVVTIYAVKENP